ncbi:MAG TPA: dihydrolipoyl dehydrogenase [Thermoplasmata archaeon]|nr:dihydrolipoyl dehydrogenase [Thermoplasmata archaeon]
MAGTYARRSEVLVIGGGPGGYIAAIRAGQLGKKVLLVEREELGGECLNRGCIPSKALIHASLLFRELLREGPEIGVIADNPRLDAVRMQAWKTGVVAKERQGVMTLLKSAGVEVLKGTARFTGPTTADVVAPDGGHERVDFASAVIATGARHATLPGFEPDGRRVVNAAQLLDWTQLPKSTIVLGGGVSGCELGEFLANVGTQVTIVELMETLLPGFEPDLVRELTSTLEKAGIRIRTSTRATGLERNADGVRLTIAGSSAAEVLEAETLFLTVGKRPDTDDLGLEEAGVEREKGGFVRVNDRQQTNVATIYAVGDCARPPMLAHKAYREGVVAAEAIAGRPTRYQFQAMPSVVFTTPELASVGWSVAEASAHGHDAREVRFPYAALGRAHAAHRTGGWVKIVGDSSTGLLLGMHAAGEAAGELVGEVAFAIEMGATVTDLALTIHPHPTFSETLQEAALLWLGEPMHVAMRRASGARDR